MLFSWAIFPLFATLASSSAIPQSGSIGTAPTIETIEARAAGFCPAGNPNPRYTVKQGDQPLQVALSQQVSTLDFLAVNGLEKDSVLRAGQILCIPPTCRLWNVRQGNTCVSIAVAFGLKTSQFFDHNPGINNPECDNMDVGSNVCLDQPHGSNFPAPSFGGN